MFCSHFTAGVPGFAQGLKGSFYHKSPASPTQISQIIKWRLNAKMYSGPASLTIVWILSTIASIVVPAPVILLLPPCSSWPCLASRTPSQLNSCLSCQQRSSRAVMIRSAGISVLYPLLCCQPFSPCSREGNGQSAALCRVWFSIQQVSGLRRAGGSAVFCLIDAQLLQVALQVKFTDQLRSSLQNPKVKGII